MTETLDEWLGRQYRHSAAAMMRSISPLDIIKTRPGFSQTVRAHRGSIVASPVPGAYDPDPDYFFHWYRDSALVVDALRLLHLSDSVRGAMDHLSDFVQFSLGLQQLDGRLLVQSPEWRSGIAADHAQFVRSDAELSALHGEAIAADTRVNPDGSLDISQWPRPQHDGVALRALTLLRWLDAGGIGDDLCALINLLLRADLGYLRRHWRKPCFDIWEEEMGLHYYTLRVSAAALRAGAVWLQRSGDADDAMTCRDDAQAILRQLDDYWLQQPQYYRSRVLPDGARSAKELDVSVILATLHSDGGYEGYGGDGGDGKHCVNDPRMQATLAKLEALFDAEYPINHDRGPQRAPAMGRYAQDVYYSGGAYYFSTLGAAEFCFRAALRSTSRNDWMTRGDQFLETVRRFTPADGELAEQFDQKSGEPRSAPQLAWSYAALITCVAARVAAIQAPL